MKNNQHTGAFMGKTGQGQTFLKTLSAAAALLLLSPSLGAGTLTVDEGVVIKFGPQAQMVVRDRLIAGKDVTLTSHKDDNVAGQTGSAAQSPVVGDWGGLRVEKSAGTFPVFSLNGWSLRYAGSQPGATSGARAALTVRGMSPGLQFLNVSDSEVGLQLLDGAHPSITGASFLRNQTGLLVRNSSGATVTGSQFAGNLGFGVNNLTPSGMLNAQGNWWGHASGAKDTVGNPQGLGDAVSTGVNHGTPMAAAPLLNPSIRVAYPAAYFVQRNVLFDVRCTNAVEYRIAQGGAFAGVPFAPLVDGQASAELTLSAGDGLKAVRAQCRNASGAIVTAELAGGVRLDTEAPVVSITNPSAGSVISQSIPVEATASDAGGISGVAFYVNGALKAQDSTAPYRYAWNIDSEPDGPYTLKVVATDTVGRTSEASSSVSVARVPLGPDTQGPEVNDIRLGPTALVNGTVIAQNAQISFNASDRSGVARAELLLDGTLMASASPGGRYSALLDIGPVSNGPHTLAVRAVDSLGNITLTGFDVTVAHAAPQAPTLTEPANGLVTREASVVVRGSAAAGSSVQLLRGGQAQGAPVTASANGSFVANMELLSGSNPIQAQASTAHGSSALSVAVNVTRDTSVPGSPSGLTAAAQGVGQVKLNWVRSTDAQVVGYHI